MLDYLFPIVTAKEKMTNEGAKRNVPHLLQAQQALFVCGQYRKRCSAKVLRHLHLVNCFREGMLDFDGPMGQCFSRFLTVSQRSRGEGEKRMEGTG